MQGGQQALRRIAELEVEVKRLQRIASRSNDAGPNPLKAELDQQKAANSMLRKRVEQLENDLAAAQIGKPLTAPPLLIPADSDIIFEQEEQPQTSVIFDVLSRAVDAAHTEGDSGKRELEDARAELARQAARLRESEQIRISSEQRAVAAETALAAAHLSDIPQITRIIRFSSENIVSQLESKILSLNRKVDSLTVVLKRLLGASHEAHTTLLSAGRSVARAAVLAQEPMAENSARVERAEQRAADYATLASSLQRQLSAAQTRVTELEEVVDEWYRAAIKRAETAEELAPSCAGDRVAQLENALAALVRGSRPPKNCDEVQALRWTMEQALAAQETAQNDANLLSARIRLLTREVEDLRQDRAQLVKALRERSESSGINVFTD